MNELVTTTNHITGAAVSAPLNPVALLLADKRSPQTRRAYAADLRAFFGAEGDPP